MAAIHVQMRLHGAERATASLARAEQEAVRRVTHFVDRGTRMLYETARTYTALTDHTLAELARLGHPYARRFAPHTLHADYLLHVQSGTLQAGLYTGGPVVSGHEVVGWVGNSTYYDKFVQLGTVKMRPRPYMAQTRADLEPVLREAARHMFRDLVVAVAVR